jgi:hypothetical protein
MAIYEDDYAKLTECVSLQLLQDKGIELYLGCSFYRPTYDSYVDKTYMPETHIWH